MFNGKSKIMLAILVTLILTVAWSLISSACIYGVLYDGGEEGKLPEHIRI